MLKLNDEELQITCNVLREKLKLSKECLPSEAFLYNKITLYLDPIEDQQTKLETTTYSYSMQLNENEVLLVRRVLARFSYDGELTNDQVDLYNRIIAWKPEPTVYDTQEDRKLWAEWARLSGHTLFVGDVPVTLYELTKMISLVITAGNK